MSEPAPLSFEPPLRSGPVNGIRMRWVDCGSGPLVLLCHGWPESWYSWRHQLQALAAAGYRAVAPDMRGYGGTEAPSATDQYTMLHLVGDLVDLVGQLIPQAAGRRALIVGHDWGANVAWHAALLRPDLFTAVVGMSVPYAPPARVHLLQALEARGERHFYIQYFQAPGVAEREFERDPRASIRRIHFTGSGDAPPRRRAGWLAEGAGFLDQTIDPAVLPPWLAADLDYYAAEFARAGFRGGLNWYRNIPRNHELLQPWRGQPIEQPSMFIAGARDSVLEFSGHSIDRFARTLPGLKGCHLLEGAGHWIQRERAEEVSRLLVGFARSAFT